ncbi:MAG: hypothetical protein WC489_08030 [Patescibacteria group bacterium]|jgi:hypothetical protein
MARRKGSKKKTQPQTIKKLGRQTGKTTVPIDKELHAMAPGLRRSSSGKKYWETRKNRSDLKNNV